MLVATLVEVGAAFAQTQRSASAEPRHPRDDRIAGERSFRRAASRRWLCHVRREVAHYERTTGLEIDDIVS